MAADDPWHMPPRSSALFDRHTIAEIHRAAATGIYDIRGFGAKRALPHFDDLLFLGPPSAATPLEGYREKCSTEVVLGTRYAKKPITLKIPITIAGMSFGSLSGPAKEALGRGASTAGTSTTTGDGGMTNDEREHSSLLVYQVLPSHYGMEPDQRRKADAIEVVVGQGAKPGGGGMLLGVRRDGMSSLGAYAKEKGVKYFLIAFVNLFGTMRAKIVPATAIDAVAKSGAGFAAWLDLNSAHPDVLVTPDPDRLMQLPWKPEVAWAI